LSLNVFQSVLVKYPLTEAVAAAILIAGVNPPLDTTGAVPVTEVTDVPGEISTKSEPAQTTKVVLPAGTVTPVVGPVTPLTITEPVAWLITIYILLWLGARIDLVVAPLAPVEISTAALAVSSAPSISVSVQLLEVTSAVLVPAIAVSIREVMLLFTTSPQVPLKSPVDGRANPKREV
jgi:hypothetical protein